MTIVVRCTPAQQQQLRRVAQSAPDRQLARRAMAIYELAQERTVSEVAELVCAARSTLYRWVAWFCAQGIDGLVRGRGGRPVRTVTGEVIERLEQLLDSDPQALGYLRSTWTSELLAACLAEHHGVLVHPSTVRRALKRTAFRWRRACPTLNKRDPRKAEKLAAIDRALNDRAPYTEVFFVDEADIDLNPRIGFTWSRRGQQTRVVTPGQNQKHYVAGALHARTGRLLWTEHPSKNTSLFIALLERLRHHYRRARRIVLIVDNYIIHKTRRVARWLRANAKFELLFQPVYYPWINRIERLWKAMHDTVTRNHRRTTLTDLCQDVKRFFEVVQPFPGAAHGVAEFGSPI